jgi:phosphomannomutase
MKIVLFDMDGTLMPARQKMGMMMCGSLAALQRNNFKIGIVTGSDIDYIMEQCKVLFDISPVDYTDIDLFPCNGTKHYTLNKDCSLKLHYQNNFKDHVGSKLYSNLVYYLLGLLSMNEVYEWSENIPLTGNFINYRGSMINFCPIGRNASLTQRNIWLDLDKKYNIRNRFLGNLNNRFGNQNITFKLGGETSIDIFPDGWDKTFVLNNFKKNDELYFVGDACHKLGNDYEIFEKINKIKKGNAFQTKGSKDTQKIILKILERQ